MIRRIGVYLLPWSLACDDGSAYDRRFDEPQVPPVGTPVEVVPAEKPTADAKACGRGTGRVPDGTCAKLLTKDAGYIQRVQIPGGRFIRGRVPSDYDATHGREAPTIRQAGQPPRIGESQSFFIDLHEVTRGAYADCVAEGKCTVATCPDGHDGLPDRDLGAINPNTLPQTCVTHAQATAFCTAHEGRLPTEPEFELAARGPDGRIYPWGNNMADEIGPGVGPAAFTPDSSYFGIRGMGSNVSEWVADEYRAEASLAPYLEREFRRPNGPLARSLQVWERVLHCGLDPAPTCRAPADPPTLHVVKGTISGSSMAARVEVPAAPLPDRSLEGWQFITHHRAVGFRCAADLAEGEVPLELPDHADPIAPFAEVATPGGPVEIFSGVAESVDRREAKAFCEVLRVSFADKVRDDWRLPTLAEIQTIAGSFRGPGPFWSATGAAGQENPRDPTSGWVGAEARDDEALLARCIRGA